MSNILLHQTPPEKDAELIDKVAQVLSTLDDHTLEVIGASSTRASNAVRAAAIKAAKARSAEHAHKAELATYEHETEMVNGRLSQLEIDLGTIRRDRSGDDWSREQSVNKIRAERSELRQRLQDLDKVRRAHIRAYGE
jgi:hypothetical protein